MLDMTVVKREKGISNKLVKAVMDIEPIKPRSQSKWYTNKILTGCKAVISERLGWKWMLLFFLDVSNWRSLS